MNSRHEMIGYNRTVKLRWLDETLDLYLAGMPEVEIYEALRERLKGELSVGREPKRGSREKTITLLLKTWVRIPQPVRGLRDDAVRLLQGTRRSERLPFHWGMTTAVYPFWRVVADVTGRLFRLQGTVAPLQVQRRMKELLGEREVVARSSRYVLRAFADWGVIDDSQDQGEYSPSAPIHIADPKRAAWLFEAAVLSVAENSVDFNSLVNGPSLFPFRIDRVFPEQLAESGRLHVMRHGLDNTLVRIR
ncbi:MAG: hypothetical protein WBW33_06330 [Bryobacteraceae bacterium]